ncbi:MAG: nitroreductase family protein [Proteobacteria bacterium]|nr:nitroreductase family protein [Pseudomonadota bacterium]
MTLKKPADANHPIHDLIRNRWSPRAFTGKPVAKATLLTVLEAARWSASSNNGQPWAFILATREDAAEHQRIVDCLMPGNQGWAKNAPVLLLTFVRGEWETEARPNRTAQHDVGLAAANLCLQAEAEGLVTHQMAGIDTGKIRETYDVPAVYEPMSAIAIGYQGETEDLDDETMREREVAPRVRKALPEFVFSGKFGASSPLVS